MKSIDKEISNYVFDTSVGCRDDAVLNGDLSGRVDSTTGHFVANSLSSTMGGWRNLRPDNIDGIHDLWRHL